MSREIKFRMWSDKHNKYVDGTFVTVSTEGELYSLDEVYVLEQYTGLKDKNGKEIYEGDIVKSKKGQRYGFVEYIENDGGFMIWWTSENEFIYLGEAIRKYEDLGVIGNIHENPELLGGEE